MNIFFPVFAISLSDFGSFLGNLESLEHFPQQQCFVLTIFNWNYLDYLSHLVLFAFCHLRCLSESCGGSLIYISIFRTDMQRYWLINQFINQHFSVVVCTFED